MPIENYVIGDVIGKGSYGEVTLASNRIDKKKYVIKKIDLHNANEKERTFAQQEVEILSKLRHPNIVSYKESFQTKDGHLEIIMGYCEGGDLYTKLKKQAKRNEFLTETQIVEWFVQIAMALQYMHDRNILHRDLKTQNIFLTKSKIIKLGDLGIARVLDSNCDMATTMIGTPYYMSPELFSNKPYNHKSDVWALGCCVYEMATLKHAFNAKDMNSLVYKILKGKTPTMPKHYSEELLEIIRSMLNQEPTSRPSASRILRHPFIKKHIALFLEGTKSRQVRKSREEKRPTTKPIAKPKAPPRHHSSPPDEVNQEALATASKIDLVLVEDEEKQVPSNKVNIEQNNNLGNGKEQNQNDENPIIIDDDKVKRSSNACSSDVKPVNGDNTGHCGKPDSVGVAKNSSQVRKILHDRMKAKAKLKEKKVLEMKKVRSVEKEQVTHAASSSSISSQESNIDVRRKQSHERRQERKRDHSSRPLPLLPHQDSEKKAVLPAPRFKKSPATKIERKVTSEENPRVSTGVPNMAARRKRREKQQESQQQFSPPSSASAGRIDSKSALSCPSFPRKSREEIIRSHLKRNSIQHEERDMVDGPNMQVSTDDKDDESSSDDVTTPSASGGKGSDVMNLIDTLQATLKMGGNGSKNSDNSRKSPEDSVPLNEGDGDVLSTTVSGRLNDRITRLRRECIDGVGLDVMKKAYQIIDTHPEEKAEAMLMKLLGDKFKDFSGRIWQLKFCEEFR